MEGIITVGELMAIAARTAPKTAGKDYVVVEILDSEGTRRLGDGMIAYGQRTRKPGFDRDGQNVLDSEAVVLIGLKDAAVPDLNCGACGGETCIAPNTFEGEFRGPNCALRHLDMGIALGSAVKTASMLNVDNRIMYRAGVVARELRLIDADFVMGIPLSATGKSIYFDRAVKAPVAAAPPADRSR
jgi:uncharacterized ferredoxin-like protein